MELKMTEDLQKGMVNWRRELNKQESERKGEMDNETTGQTESEEMKERVRESVNGNSNDRGIRRWAITQIRGGRGQVRSAL